MPLLDQYGKPMASSFKKAAPPKTGEMFGKWAGSDVQLLQLPGGGIIQFDLSKLTLADYRAMTTHYQVNSSLSILSFMLHQSNWTIECEDDKIAQHCTDNLTEIWTQLNRGLSQAHWAGFSPNVLQWENDLNTGTTVIAKVKDLLPEMCAVNWKEVDGYAPPGNIPPKLRIYDGIKQFGTQFPIPVENSLWYPLLMENGDFYGRKLLKAAYTSYFFSMLMHLFSNRYYERFGEPVPIGRAPFDDIVQVPDSTAPDGFREQRSNDYMLDQLMSLRNRSVVVLPSDHQTDANGRTGYFEYDIQYLESQMRGADFERYMQRLDQEISLAMFTPVLLMNTADVGSYNLGIGHMQMYLWMLNAINGDRASYINKYVLAPMARYNFPPNSPLPRIRFQKLDNNNQQLLTTIMQSLIQSGQIIFDAEQISNLSGLSIQQVGAAAGTLTGGVVPDADGGDQQGTGTITSGSGDSSGASEIINQSRARNLRTQVVDRVRGQVNNAFRNQSFGPAFELKIGFKRQLLQSLIVDGIDDPNGSTEGVYARLDAWASDMSALGTDYMKDAEQYAEEFGKLWDYEVDRLKT